MDDPAAEQLILDVPALNVRFVFVVNSTARDPLIVTVLDPKLIVLIFVFVEANLPVVTL
jgi:hypothetical protein